MVPVCFNKFSRLPICLGKDSLIVNTGRNSVSSIQFHSHKLLQSWVLKQPHSFTCPVVYQDSENMLLSVMDKNILVTWDAEADDLGNAKEVKFHEDIFGIVSVLGYQVIVFNSGSCLLLDDAISKHEFLTKSYLKNEEKMLWVDAAPYESSILLFLLTHTNNGKHVLHSLLLSTSDGKMEKLSEQEISRDSALLQSWCIKSGDTHPSFLTIWSDGQVYCYLGNSKSSVHLFTVSGVEEKELLAVEVLDSCHTVIVRRSLSKGCSYELWDTRYSTKKASKSIDSHLSQNLQAKVLGDILFLPSDDCIVAEPLKVAFSTLAAVVGRSSNNVEIQEMDELFYSWNPDGTLQQESSEEQALDKASNSMFTTVTKDGLFDELVTRLYKADVKAISSYLKEIKLISEAKLVRLLQHLLRVLHPDFREKSSKRPFKNSTKVSKLFLCFFRIPYDDIFLQQHLHKLSFKEAMATLQMLYLILNLLDGKPRSACLSYIQVMKWMSLLLLSRFGEFMLLNQNEFSTVGNVLRIVTNKIRGLDLKDISLFHCQELNFESSANANYCIEILNL